MTRTLYDGAIHQTHYPPQSIKGAPDRYDRVIRAVSARIQKGHIRALEIGAESPLGPDRLCGKIGIGREDFEILEVSQRSVEMLVRDGWSARQHDISEHEAPFTARAFDLVVMCEVLEHLLRPDFAMREIHRLLKPDGLLCLTTPNLSAWFNRVLLLFGTQPVYTETSLDWTFGRARFLPRARPVGHLRIYTVPALLQFMAYHGFSVEAFEGLGIEPSILTSKALRLVDGAFARWPGTAAGLLLVSRPTGTPSSGSR